MSSARRLAARHNVSRVDGSQSHPDRRHRLTGLEEVEEEALVVAVFIGGGLCVAGCVCVLHGKSWQRIILGLSTGVASSTR